MADHKYAQCFGWCDIETTGLPVGNDYSKVYILEFAFMLTDFDLVKYAGFHDMIKPTPAAVEQLRLNPVVIDMHKKSGLLQDLSGATLTLAEVEQEAIALIKEKTTFDKGEIMLAGSGVTAFDFNVIKEHMPELASYFSYFSGDIGIVRRMVDKLGAGHKFWNPVASSYQEGVKAHRAWGDMMAHYEEAVNVQKWLKSLT